MSESNQVDINSLHHIVLREIEDDSISEINSNFYSCLLYTSDTADDSLRVDLGGRRIIKKTA